jgi:hypothetical protein
VHACCGGLTYLISLGFFAILCRNGETGGHGQGDHLNLTTWRSVPCWLDDEEADEIIAIGTGQSI